jgi:hypothetical protein
LITVFTIHIFMARHFPLVWAGALDTLITDTLIILHIIILITVTIVIGAVTMRDTGTAIGTVITAAAGDIRHHITTTTIQDINTDTGLLAEETLTEATQGAAGAQIMQVMQALMKSTDLQ